MLTYQDLFACGHDEQRRMEFIIAAINQHKNSNLYQTAVYAQKYYDGENPTINQYEKILYDMQGKAHQDMYTANHKIASVFFKLAVQQECSYLLGNGVTFQKKTTQKKLGEKFDLMVSRAGLYSIIGGVSFGFWNLDHVEVFKITEFVPLYDEENGALSAGIRFWQIDRDKPMRATLYELDGITEYIQKNGSDLEVIPWQGVIEKRPYIIHATTAEMDNTVIYGGNNYPNFPIVPLKNNEQCKSEIIGKRNTIDALDLACSNMVNGADEGNIIYWALVNCGGMDLTDAEKFLYMVKKYHIAFMDNVEDGARAEPHTIEAPFTGTQATIDMLEKKLYQDFQAFDASAVTAGNQTATAIKASYVPLDLKTDGFEERVTEFILGILALAGIDDKPTYTRNQIINKQEEMQTVLMAAPYTDTEYTTTKALTILGDADMVEDVLKRRAAEDLGRFDDNQDGETSGGLISAIKKAIQILAKAIGLKAFAKDGGGNELEDGDSEDVTSDEA